MLTSPTSKRGLDREARAALLRVRTGLECPKGNLSELTWASKPDWDSYRAKSPNLRHLQACAQNKGLNRTSRLQTIPLGDRQPEPEGGNHSPREALSTKLQASFFAN